MSARVTPIVAGAGIVAATLLGGCKATASLSEREVVVHFQVGTTLEEKERVAAACSATPDASPEPLPDSPSAPQAKLNEVRFRVDKASQSDINALYRCLRRFPSAIGTERVDQ